MPKELNDWTMVVERSMKYRGEIIHAVSRLDRVLDIYIATYFCSNKEKRADFANIILGGNRISLDGKRKLFDILIKKQTPDFFIRHPDFNKNMNTVMYERNSFAHNILCSNEEAIDKMETHIGLQKFSVKNRVEWYSEERINDILKEIKKCSHAIALEVRNLPSPPEKE